MKWLPLLLIVLLAGCVSNDRIKQALIDDPTIITEAIKKHPTEFFSAVQEASQIAQRDMLEKQRKKEEDEFNAAFDKPFNPKLDGEVFQGAADAPIVIVMYSDFQCPFCVRGHKTVEELMKNYNGKIKFYYKHKPMDFHDMAKISAQYYEAIRLQDPKKAFKFMNEVYGNQSKLNKDKEAFLKATAKKVGADLKKVAAKLNSSEVENKIKQDEAESSSFGIEGTPGFLLNGIPIRGAYPLSHFQKVIDELKNRGKLSL